MRLMLVLYSSDKSLSVVAEITIGTDRSTPNWCFCDLISNLFPLGAAINFQHSDIFHYTYDDRLVAILYTYSYPEISFGVIQTEQCTQGSLFLYSLMFWNQNLKSRCLREQMCAWMAWMEVVSLITTCMSTPSIIMNIWQLWDSLGFHIRPQVILSHI